MPSRRMTNAHMPSRRMTHAHMPSRRMTHARLREHHTSRTRAVLTARVSWRVLACPWTLTPLAAPRLPPASHRYISLSGISLVLSDGPNEDEAAQGVSYAPTPSSSDRGGARHLPPRLEQRLRLQVRSIQVDNQLYNTAYPVTLASEAAPEGEDDDDDPDGGVNALRLVLVRDVSFSSRRFAYVRVAALHLRPLSMMLDEESGRAFAAFLDIFDRADTSMSAKERERARTVSTEQLCSELMSHAPLPTHA
jgi:hypothetical protein